MELFDCGWDRGNGLTPAWRRADETEEQGCEQGGFHAASVCHETQAPRTQQLTVLKSARDSADLHLLQHPVEFGRARAQVGQDR
jgi:hypothetical protein